MPPTEEDEKFKYYPKDGSSRYKAHHYDERVIFYIRDFSNCSILHCIIDIAIDKLCLDHKSLETNLYVTFLIS